MYTKIDIIFLERTDCISQVFLVGKLLDTIHFSLLIINTVVQFQMYDIINYIMNLIIQIDLQVTKK